MHACHESAADYEIIITIIMEDELSYLQFMVLIIDCSNNNAYACKIEA
jgi:hypothetical protein